MYNFILTASDENENPPEWGFERKRMVTDRTMVISNDEYMRKDYPTTAYKIKPFDAGRHFVHYTRVDDCWVTTCATLEDFMNRIVGYVEQAEDTAPTIYKCKHNDNTYVVEF